MPPQTERQIICKREALTSMTFRTTLRPATVERAGHFSRRRRIGCRVRRPLARDSELSFIDHARRNYDSPRGLQDLFNHARVGAALGQIETREVRAPASPLI